ncbi:hypothetical protein HMPREF9120_02233 [Neisseria sp. oral taxon 020 str. F0370]|nr:hypothetical protein HMPREF9120_02233 [Neisseria sp. oral taxon 020 str. F0370]
MENRAQLVGRCCRLRCKRPSEKGFPAFRRPLYSESTQKDTRQQAADSMSNTRQVFLAFPMP